MAHRQRRENKSWQNPGWGSAILMTLLLTITIATLILGSTIAVRISLALRQSPLPQAILVLEGNADRVPFAAQFSQLHPTLPIWISGNRRRQSVNQGVLQQAGVSVDRVFFDFCAVDTVTNFTCNVETFTSRGFHHVYLITSSYHMRRSLAIATLVFGSRGIAVTPVAVASVAHPPEALWRIGRDCVRSVIWMFTGWTGAELG